MVSSAFERLRYDSIGDPMSVHLGRVLLLVDTFTTRKASLEGLPKLARLDFLLRYPTYLEAVLDLREKDLPFGLRPTREEREAPEGANIRWKYGPWDHRYYPLLGQLVGRALIEAEPSSGTLQLRSTAAGRGAASTLDGAAWEIVRGRTKALRRGADLAASTLTTLIAPLLRDDDAGRW